ncbi:MAG: glycosyltransferase family 4 protein [bacterium]|nr:glycosyltransferase family 4 protein [bacterium]
MRILLFAQAFYPIVGGAERFLDRLARELTKRGHDVCVLAARVRGVDNHFDAPYQVMRYRKPLSKRRFPKQIVLSLLWAHHRFRPDIIHAHGAYPHGCSAATYSRWTRTPMVVRPIGGDVLPNEKVQNDPLLKRRVQHCLQGAKGVVAQSMEFEALVGKLGVAPERVSRIPNGIDLGLYSSTQSANPAATIAAMGIFFKKKGFDILIEAFQKVIETHPTARLVIAGAGVEEQNLRAQISAAGLGDSVELPGLLEEEGKRDLFARSALFVSSARREPFSNANLEALGAGLPLVATEVGGNCEIVESGLNGFLVPPEDACSMANAIVRLLDDFDLREQMGKASQELASKYCWNKIAGQYEAFYQKQLEGEF